MTHDIETTLPEGTIDAYRRSRPARRRGFLYRLTHRSNQR
jgi:hypothetical protein